MSSSPTPRPARPAVHRLGARRAPARRRWSSGWCRWCRNSDMSRSYTSRPARAGEQDGVDYNFISRERFEAMVREGAFLEWADVFGNYYGTGAADTEACWPRGGRGAGDRRAGRAAGAQPRASRPSASSCCRRRRPCSSSGCAGRSKDSEEQIRRRLEVARARGRRVRAVRVRGRQRRARRRPSSGCGPSCWRSGRG